MLAEEGLAFWEGTGWPRMLTDDPTGGLGGGGFSV